MYKRMLIPLDGSEIAKSVFPYAKELVARLGLEVTLLYVRDPLEQESLSVHQAYVDHMAEIIIKEALETREKAGIREKDQLLKAEGKVVTGHPAEEILNCAAEQEIDLLLMATHGRSGIRRWSLGSVADKVLRSSALPVWLVRAGEPESMTGEGGQIGKIVVPLDGSELSEYVLPYVESLAKQWDAELIDVVLLMVCEPLVIPPVPTIEIPVNWGNIVEEHLDYSKKAAGQYLAKLARRFKEAGLEVDSEVVEGLPADEIINYISGNPDCLIAMATHGRSGLSRWAYGSIADKVLSGAPSPVLLVRPPSTEGLSLMDTFMGTVQSLPPI
ncbi:universal stress protein [Chloroflexota bacterium]